MNCKQGDLAVLVKPISAQNIGKFVTVLEPLGHLQAGTEFNKDGNRFVASTSAFHWWVEAQTLRPIRDNPGADETLAWKPIPVDHKEIA